MQGDDERRAANEQEALLAKLRGVLDDWASGTAPPRVTVAFSGGVDSTVLLAALHGLDLGMPLRAAHVDHGLHPDSERWSRHCAAVAAELGVELVTRRVAVDRASPHGLEAAAREARYAALGELLIPGEWLLTAHHADDQLETLLLRLLRGSGVRGLRGIVAFGPFATGWLGRPLLECTRAELGAVARSMKLTWLEDPSNRETRHDRNYLREQVLPALRARWPAAAHHAERLAAQMSDAEQLLEAFAVSDAESLAAPWFLPRAVLAGLSAARQRNLLRYLVRQVGMGTPSARKIEELRATLFTARANSSPVVVWPTGQARVFRKALFLLAPLSKPSSRGYTASLAKGERWSGPEGHVALVPAAGAHGLPESWLADGLTLRFRGGGERFRPSGRAHHHTLKHLFQEAGVVPWMRTRVPMLYRGSELVAIGDLWITADADAAPADEPRWRVEWTRTAPLTAPSSN
jgi:tRNA(Ile)-lysidine synthase